MSVSALAESSVVGEIPANQAKSTSATRMNHLREVKRLAQQSGTYGNRRANPASAMNEHFLSNAGFGAGDNAENLHEMIRGRRSGGEGFFGRIVEAFNGANDGLAWWRKMGEQALQF